MKTNVRHVMKEWMRLTNEEVNRNLLKYKWKWMVGDRITSPTGKTSTVISVDGDEITMLNHEGKMHKERGELLITYFEDALLFEDHVYILERGYNNLDDELFKI